MTEEEGESAAPMSGHAAGDGAGAPARSARHRRHRFPARDRVVKVRYDEGEHAVLAAAAARAGLTVAGFLAGAGLSVAGQGPPGPVSLIWPHRDGLIWPHLRHAGAVFVTV